MNPRFFPTILIILDVLSAFVWLYHGDFRKFIYWMSAAFLTISITY
jgi:hypothetical protein